MSGSIYPSASRSSVAARWAWGGRYAQATRAADCVPLTAVFGFGVFYMTDIFLCESYSFLLTLWLYGNLAYADRSALFRYNRAILLHPAVLYGAFTLVMMHNSAYDAQVAGMAGASLKAVVCLATEDPRLRWFRISTTPDASPNPREG